MAPTVARVAEALSRLAIARATLLDEVTLSVYADALEDVDPGLVDRACRRLGKTPRAEYDTAMPDVGTIRDVADAIGHEDAEAARAQLVKQLPAPVGDDEVRYACLSCRDESSGFRPFWCPGTGEHRTLDRPARSEGSIVECGRPQAHGSHDYVARCECWLRNPVVEARRQRQLVKRAAPKERRQAS